MIDIRRIEHDKQAITPVIGIILMLAIVVILGGVTAAFAIGFVNDVPDNTAPTYSGISIEYVSSEDVEGDNPQVRFEHTGGESIDLSQLTLSRDVPDTYEGENIQSADSDSPIVDIDENEEEFSRNDEFGVEFDVGEGEQKEGELILIWSEDGSGSDGEIIDSIEYEFEE